MFLVSARSFRVCACWVIACCPQSWRWSCVVSSLLHKICLPSRQTFCLYFDLLSPSQDSLGQHLVSMFKYFLLFFWKLRNFLLIDRGLAQLLHQNYNDPRFRLLEQIHCHLNPCLLNPFHIYFKFRKCIFESFH